METLRNNCLKKLVCIAAMLLVLNTPVLAYPPDPDNAALLYYQAFLLCGQPDDTVDQMLKEFLEGKIKANEKIVACAEKYQEAIRLATIASEIAHCDWGLKYSDGLSMQMPYLGHARILSRLMITDARILAGFGDIKSALERCVAAQKMGRHFGTSTYVGYLMGLAIGKMSNTCVQDILSETSCDLETLNRLSMQLDHIDRMPFSNIAGFENEATVMRTYINKEKAKKLLEIDELIADKSVLAILRDRLERDDGEFFQRNTVYWDNYIARFMSVLALPYSQAYPEVEKLSKERDEMIKNPDATLTVILAPAQQIKILNRSVKGKTYFNVIRAAVEIYKIKAETGQLPDELPAGLPKDLFSGKDFIYEKKPDCFVLRCQGKDLEANEIHEYEFKVGW